MVAIHKSPRRNIGEPRNDGEATYILNKNNQNPSQWNEVEENIYEQHNLQNKREWTTKSKGSEKKYISGKPSKEIHKYWSFILDSNLIK